MGNTERVLRMTFLDELDEKHTISISNPKEAIEEQEIKTFMDLVVSKNIFMSNNAGDLVKPLEAKITVTDVTNFDLVIED